MSTFDDVVGELLEQAVAERVPFWEFMDRLVAMIRDDFPDVLASGTAFDKAARAAAIAAAQRLPKESFLVGLWSGYNSAIKGSA